MRSPTNLITHKKFHVANRSKQPAIVLIFPITRVSPENRSRWKKIVSIANSSSLANLVVIDKTEKEEATQFFSRPKLLGRTDLYILRRPPNEPIYNSQAFITVEKGLWVIQVHDDDLWDGLLELPRDAAGLQLFSTKFKFHNRKEQSQISWLNSPPSRINFTLLPYEIWNRFTQYIDAQGGHVAGSVDSTLNLVSRMLCTSRHITEFTYEYDNRHWEYRRQATKNLQTLARQDGWGVLSGVDVALLNRKLDGLSAIIFFAPLSQTVDVKKEIDIFMRNSAISYKRYCLIKAKNLIYRAILQCIGLLKVFQKSERILNIVESQVVLTSALIRIRNDSNIANIVACLINLREHVDSPALRKRIDFWLANLNHVA
jgi:hypothetical protein